MSLEYLRGQGYDGAAAMSGEFRGAQAVIKEEYPLKSHFSRLAVTDWRLWFLALMTATPK